MKDISVVNFGGGLGDVIGQSFKSNVYNNLCNRIKEGDKPIIQIISVNKSSKELFTSIPNIDKSTICDFAELYPDFFEQNFTSQAERQKTITKLTQKFLQKKYNIKYVNHLFVDDLPWNPVIYPTEADLKILNTYKGESFIVLHASSGDPKRNFPEKIITKIVNYFSKYYMVVRIGRDDSHITIPRKEIIAKSHTYNFVSLINRLSVPGSLALMQMAKGVVASDSFASYFIKFANQNALIVLPNNHPKYGFIDINERQPYFSHFDRNNVIPVLWEDMDDTILDRFRELLSV